MRKVTKVSWIMVAILAATGIAFSIAGLVSGASFSDIETLQFFNNYGEAIITVRPPSPPSPIKPEPPAQAEPQIPMEGDAGFAFIDIDKLDLELGIAEMEIYVGDSHEFLVYTENTNEDFVCEVRGTTLVMRHGDAILWNGGGTPKITLEIPGGSSFEKCKIQVGVGSLKAEYLNTGNLDIECGIGKVSIEDSYVWGKCKIENGVGQVELSLFNMEEEFDYKIECGIGEVHIGDTKYSGLANQKKIDNGNESYNRMDIECGIGKVRIDFDFE